MIQKFEEEQFEENPTTARRSSIWNRIKQFGEGLSVGSGPNK